MRMVAWFGSLFIFSLMMVQAQESLRQAERPGAYTKYLAFNQTDTWLLAAQKEEILIVAVSSQEFDPVLELVTIADKLLIAVDDEGSDSRFARRFPEAGDYKILVRAFSQGGGNYTLSIQRFIGKPITSDTRWTGMFGPDGQSHLYFAATRGQIVIPEIRGTNQDNWEILDPRGVSLGKWSGTVNIETEGEHTLTVHGRANVACQVVVRQAKMRSLDKDQPQQAALVPGEMDVWNIRAVVAEFSLLEVMKKGLVLSKLAYAPELPVAGKKPAAITGPGSLPELRYLVNTGKGERLQQAVIWGRTGHYQFYVLARSPVNYSIKMSDPTQGIPFSASAVDKESDDTTGVIKTGRIKANIRIGESGFYTFSSRSGQLWQIEAATDNFDPYLRLYNMRGELVAENDDGGLSLASRIGILVQEAGTYRLQIASVGNGGGGNFTMNVWEKTIPALQLGERKQSELGTDTEEYWAFDGRQGSTVIFQVRSPSLEPSLKLYSPAGVLLRTDDRNYQGGTLMAIVLPESGRYIMVVTARYGQGSYTIRLWEGD